MPGTPNNVAVGDINFNTITNTEYTIDQTTETTNTTTISEQYTLTGQVVAVGTIHAEVQSGLFDLGGRLLGRLGRIEAGNAGWGEFYGFRVNQRGRRDAWGFAGGVGVAVAPGVTLAAGVDHGQARHRRPRRARDRRGHPDPAGRGAALRQRTVQRIARRGPRLRRCRDTAHDHRSVRCRL
ncbi:hypothetical protein [Sphingopyxis sp. PET50]|uniref:hypothetical protein n=1 Tax=Sphingopyxis sp. PET50 TaxID=2976533 RepID=UPI0021AEB383|nr:hypothetical protein [Sphingopyxis sp. PET50]